MLSFPSFCLKSHRSLLETLQSAALIGFGRLRPLLHGKRIQKQEGRPDDWYLNIPRQIAPIGGLLTPDLVAKHVLFWLDDASAPITGQVYEVTQTPFLGRSASMPPIE